MSLQKWKEFDNRLEERLSKLQGDVEITEEEMGKHYDRFTNSIRETIKEVVPAKAKIKAI